MTGEPKKVSQWDGRKAEHEEAKAARRLIREANREEWRRHRVNSNRITEETLDAVVPVTAGVTVDATSLGKMRAIMADVAAPLYRRLDAAEVVLGYELAPASLVDVPAQNVAAASFRFMRAIADAPETPERLQFRALKAIIAIENSRAAARQSAGQQLAKRELQRQLGRDPEWAGSLWLWPPQNVAMRLERARAAAEHTRAGGPIG